MSNTIEFDLTEKLREKGITRIAKEKNTIVIDFNENSIRFYIDHNNWMKTIKNFEDQVKGIINDLTLKSYLKTFLNQKYEILENDNTSLDNIKNNGKEILKIFKYSKYGKIALHEAIILDDKPVFIKYDHDNKRIEIVENIVETTRIIIPPSREECPYTSYEFESTEELNHFIEKAKTITLDELYIKCKLIFSKYVDQENHVIILLTTDSIWTYFQDLFPTTHYFEGVGTNDVGKSSVGSTFEYTGYRVVKATAITGPNYYRLLGTSEPGQCVIIEDEGDNISEDSDKVKILKAGYELDGKVPKINMSSKNQEQKWYYAYCYKMILAEKSLNQSKAKGVVDRTFSVNFKPGNPKYSIKNLIHNKLNKNPKCLELYNELLEFRKLMLCYRLVHYKDLLPEIDTGLKNRDSELCNPTIQLFYGTQAMKEIIPTLEIFVKQRRERKSNSVEAVLYTIIKELIDDLNTVPNLISIPFSMIWGKITDGSSIEGNYNFNTPNQYETSDYIIYQNTLSKLIRDKFGGKLDRKEKGSNLIFNKNEFAKFDKVYENPDKTVIKLLEVKPEIIFDDLGGEENYDEIDRMLNSVDSVSNEGNEGKSKCVGSDTMSKEDENNIIENENSLENSVDVLEENVGYVDTEGILERVCINIVKKENEILTNNDSMKANTQNNNLHIFYYNNNKVDSLFTNEKKRDTHPLEPTQPTFSSSSAEKESSALQCPNCDYKGIEVDLGLHIYEKHRDYLRQLQRDSSDFNIRTDYVIEQIKLQQQGIKN